MPFIFTDCMGKSQPDKRKLIRQHVMLGKNRGKTRKGTGKTNASSVTETNKDVQDGSSELVMKMKYPRIPDRVGNELSFTQFAAPVEPPLMQDLLKCEASHASDMMSFCGNLLTYPFSLSHGKKTIISIGKLHRVPQEK